MQETQRKEDLSISYISALCAYGGIAYETVRHDDDSTDGTLRKRIALDNNRKFDAELRIQLKCTSSISQYADKEDYMIYKLRAKNYNDLCLESTTPIILGLLVLPEDETAWLSWTPEELLIRGTMYWAEFTSQVSKDNSGIVSVKIDKKNVINADTLNKILEKIAREEWP